MQRLNNGLYHVGQINAGETKQAFIYFSTLATTDTVVNDQYRVSLYDGNPATGTLKESADFSFANVQVTQKNAVNKLSTVTFSSGGLFTGTGTLAVCVAPLPSVTVKTIRWLPDLATAAFTSNR